MDPTCGTPGRIDVILGSELLNDIMRQGWRDGPHLLPGKLSLRGYCSVAQGGGPAKQSITVHHATVTPNPDILRRFWEIEETPGKNNTWTPQEQAVMTHFQQNHI